MCKHGHPVQCGETAPCGETSEEVKKKLWGRVGADQNCPPIPLSQNLGHIHSTHKLISAAFIIAIYGC